MYGPQQVDVLALNKCISGLVQTITKYHNKAVEDLHKIGFTGEEVDPCLFWKQYEKGVVFVAVNLDDNLVVDHPEAIKYTAEQLKKNGFVVKVGDDLKDFLTIQFQENKSIIRTTSSFGKFGKEVWERCSMCERNHDPGTPSVESICPINEDEKISEKQKQYCAGAGILLCLVKHWYLDIANAVREPSKVFNGANMAAYQEILLSIL